MNLFRNLGLFLTLAGIVCAGITASKAEAASPPYSSYTVLSKPHKTNIVPTALNSSDQIVGVYTDTHLVQHGFVSTHGAYTKVDVPGGYPGTTAPSGINEFGMVVGSYQDGVNFGERGFVLNNGVYTTFTVTLANAVPNTTYALGINDFGQVVGNYLDYNGVTRGFLLSNGVYTSFDIHVADPSIRVNATLPAGINDLGQITGFYTTDINGDPLTVAAHGFVLSGHTTTTLDVPGALNGTYGAGTQATGINLLGQVVGIYVDTDGATHGFVWSCGKYTYLDTPNAVNTTTFGINALGQVVGYYSLGTFNDNGSIFYGFVLNP